MIKKVIAGTILSAMTLFALPNDELKLAGISQAAQKKLVVLTNMKLKGDEKEKFGKLYDEYQEVLMIHRITELKLIGHYAKNFTNMTNEASDKLITEWLAVEKEELTLKKIYMDKFKGIMNTVEVIRYFQIENRLQLMGEIQKSKLIPLAIPNNNNKEK